MASDAYMEVETRSLIGESLDAKFGMDTVDVMNPARQQGAFEISDFSFTCSTEEPEKKDKDKDKDKKKDTSTATKTSVSSNTTTNTKEPKIDSFTIKKAIDSSSAELFMLCCKCEEIEWGVVSFREAGGDKHPWLIIEFSKLLIDSFEWDIDPEASGDSLKSFETIKFKFGTLVIKYQSQAQSGVHAAPQIKGWDFNNKRAWNGTPNLKSESW